MSHILIAAVGQEAVQQLIDFFQYRLTFLDFLIIGMGLIIFLYQMIKRFTTFSGSFYKKAQEDPLFITREKLKLQYISSTIEILPIMGIMGTVWALMNALRVISTLTSPDIKAIATQIAPALSTTFFGLFFATINLFFFNFLYTYYSELIAWCYYTGGIEKPKVEEEEQT